MDIVDQDNESEDTKERREFTRFPVNLRLKFLDPNIIVEKEVQVSDISAKGVGVWVDRALAKDVALEIRIEIPDNGQVRYSKGTVVWSKQVEPNKYRAGISLEKVDLIGVSVILRATYGENWL